MFNSVPQSDQEVEDSFKALYRPEFLARCLIGLYKCSRAEGEDVLTAYKHTLEKYLEIAERKGKPA